jgi:hypothetical protein
MRRMVGGVLAVAALAVSVLAAFAAPALAATRRDPSVQPFAVDSIWNTPIGRDARYVPADLRTPAVGLDLVTVAATTGADPAERVRSSDCATAGKRRRLPASLHLPAIRAPQALAVVAPDGRTVDAWTSVRRCDTSVGGRYAGRTRIDGDGVPDGGSVAGLPGLGGALRGTEFTGTAPVPHALALLVPARYLAAGPGWPAVRSDGTRATAPSGGAVRLGAVRLGALLALPAADAAELPVTSPMGRRLVAALRDHGAYVAGATAGTAVQVRVDAAAVTGQRAATGRAFSRDAGLQEELRAAVQALAVVADSTPGAVGGSGARRAPLAAPLQAITPPSPTPSPSPTASPAGASPSESGTAASTARIPSAPVAQVEGPHTAPPAAVAAIAALALVLLGVGLGAGRAAARLFS